MKRYPQPLILRHDLVAYPDGSFLEIKESSIKPPPPPTPTSSSPFAILNTPLLSNQQMGTLVLSDLVILTNEIPWSTVAKECTVLSAEDMAFDLFGTFFSLFFYVFFFFLVLFNFFLPFHLIFFQL
jgi:hypothetical protein